MWSAVVVCLAGCGPDPEGTMGGGTPSEAWEGLDTFENNALFGPAYAAEMGDWAGAQREITSDNFKSALDTFAASPVPEAYADKQAEKDALVQKFRDAVDAAGTADFEAKWEAAMDALRKIRGADDSEE